MTSQREYFEKWYQEEVSGCHGTFVEKDEANKYYEKGTRTAWIVWQQATLVEREACVDICRELYANDGITCAEYIMERE
jgi:hypothetical protein